MLPRLRQVLAIVVLVALPSCTSAGDAPADRTGDGRRPSPGVVRPPVEVVRPASAAQAADQVEESERLIEDPRTTDRDLVVAGQAQQLAYRTWSDHPGWDGAVLGALPRDLRSVAADNLAARRALRSIYPVADGALPRELPAWRISQPRPAEELRAYYREAERRTVVGWTYLAAINFVETAFGRIAGDSEAGAQGPMQFIPTTWGIYGGGGDVTDPHDSILAAGRLLADHGFADDPRASLFHYNNHEGYVGAVSLLAGLMERRPRAFLGYHAWQVYYLTHRGPVLLPEGYDESRPVPVDEWIAEHPQA